MTNYLVESVKLRYRVETINFNHEASMENVQSLVYASTAVHEFTQSELLTLLDCSRERNARCGITGVLLYGNSRFVQCIEGTAISVEKLFAEIQADARHKNIVEMVNEQIPERSFGSWAMGYHPLDSKTFESLLSVSKTYSSGRHLPASGSKGKQLLQIVWEQMVLEKPNSSWLGEEVYKL